MPLTREQLRSVLRLLKEARALVGDAQDAFRSTSGAAQPDLDAAERLRKIARELGSELEYIQRRIDGHA